MWGPSADALCLISELTIVATAGGGQAGAAVIEAGRLLARLSEVVTCADPVRASAILADAIQSLRPVLLRLQADQALIDSISAERYKQGHEEGFAEGDAAGYARAMRQLRNIRQATAATAARFTPSYPVTRPQPVLAI